MKNVHFKIEQCEYDNKIMNIAAARKTEQEKFGGEINVRKLRKRIWGIAINVLYFKTQTISEIAEKYT